MIVPLAGICQKMRCGRDFFNMCPDKVSHKIKTITDERKGLVVLVHITNGLHLGWKRR